MLTGEHGVGVEKRDLMPEMFNEVDLDQQMRVKCAFDPNHLLNPGKVFPQLAPLRRARPHACPSRAGGFSGYSEVLRVHCDPRPATEVGRRSHTSPPCGGMSAGQRRQRRRLPPGRPLTTFTPATSADVLAAVQWAVSENAPLEIVGHGTKRGIGRPLQTAHTLDLSQLTGVTLYEPEELVLTAKAGTPLAEIEAMLAERNQELAFEPMDYGPLLGHELRAERARAAPSAACSPPISPVRAG